MNKPIPIFHVIRAGHLIHLAAAILAICTTAESTQAADRVLRTPGVTSVLRVWPSPTGWVVGLVGNPSDKSSLSCMLQDYKPNENGNGYYRLLVVWNSKLNHLAVNDTDPNVLQPGEMTVAVDGVEVARMPATMRAPDRSEQRLATNMDDATFNQLIGLFSTGQVVKVTTPNADYNFQLAGARAQIPNLQDCRAELNLMLQGRAPATTLGN